MKRRFLKLVCFAITVFLAFSLCSCSNAEGAYGGGAVADGGVTGGDYKGDGGLTDGDVVKDYVAGKGEAGAAEADGGDETAETGSTGNQTFTPKTITAAAWNDNDNYAFWKGLLTYSETDQQRLFAGALPLDGTLKAMSLDERVEVTVKQGERAVAGAKVELVSANGDSVFNAVTDMNGKAYVFGKLDGAKVKATSGDFSAEGEITEGAAQVDLSGSIEKANVIDIMFLTDTTGSMGDELEFLKVEIDDVIKRIAAANEGAVINLSLMFYRDIGDEYVTRCFDFLNISDGDNLKTQLNNLSKQSANGGGDTPEAVDQALAEAVAKQWSSGTSTKLLFHVLDAPLHDESAKIANFAAAVNTAAKTGIRIIPIIASGMDKIGEYTMRQAALRTGGTYVFITDDSGYGNTHSVPTVGEHTVEYLNSLLVRLTTEYHTGVKSAPIDWRQEQ